MAGNWFKGKEINKILGYEDTDKVIRTLVSAKYKRPYPAKMAGQHRNQFFISEPGFYELVSKSKLQNA